jgi:translation initiation factor 4G
VFALTIGNIAFGTVDLPNPLLSSSPAAPSLTGSHLADTVKSFGSIQADSATDTDAVKASRPNMSPSAPPKQLDVHALFGAKKPVNGMPSQGGYTPYPQNPGQHMRPPGPGQSRSPVLGNPQFAPQMQQGFRPQPQPVRPMQPMQRPVQGMGQYGMHPGPQSQFPMMGYPGQNYYVSCWKDQLTSGV